MNEMFAAEPNFARTALELKMFLDRFGPTSGRYLAALPKGWHRAVAEAFAEASPVEQKRVMVAIEGARRRASVLARPDFPWNFSVDWRANASRLASPAARRLRAAVVSPDVEDVLLPGLVRADQIDLDLTAEEEIDATAVEFKRVCSIVIAMKGDIHIVDPYLDPCMKEVFEVLSALVGQMATARVASLTLWVRKSILIREHRRSPDEIEGALRRAGAGAVAGLPITLNLLYDRAPSSRMHDRYLFSIKGGISSGNGFQALAEGGRTKVSPMSTVVLDAYVRRYHERDGHAPIHKSITTTTGTTSY